MTSPGLPEHDPRHPATSLFRPYQHQRTIAGRTKLQRFREWRESVGLYWVSLSETSFLSTLREGDPMLPMAHGTPSQDHVIAGLVTGKQCILVA